MSSQLELFLRIAAGLVLVRALWGLISILLDLEVQAEAEETDNVQVAAYHDTRDARERFGR
jgi:hypothetical protein